ncbi:RING zinc finger-containing protein, partial [Trypanosoma grayi]|uniref:RING zinc finger-containing protein n=1 Tax=Trypanosoma grayi TaxID=71804 RepID=UPI0004F4A89E
MATVWRSFKFFESEVLKGPLNHMEMTCCCYSHKAIFVADGEGFVYAVDRGGNATQMEFPAYKGAVTHMKHLRSRNVLVTLGDDDALNTCIMRVWSLDAAAGGKTATPPPCREHRLFSAKHPPPAESVVLRTNYNAEVMQSLKFKGREGDAAKAIPVTAFHTVVVSFDV